MPNDEPRGHRGHPYDREARRARRVAEVLTRAVGKLIAEGFTEPEAVAFIAGLAYEHGVAQGETWSSPTNARDTLERMLDGRGAKEWSTDAVVLALFDIGSLLGRERSDR